jgi:uncharacterized membrane protein YecN with MAPEG domain
MAFTAIIGIILLISVIITAFGFIKKIKILRYLGIFGIITTFLLLAFLIIGFYFSDM